MPAAAKPMGMIMDVTGSCGEGGREAAVRRSASSFFFLAKRAFGAFPRAQCQPGGLDEPWARVSREGVLFQASREARARETYQRRAPEVDVSLRSLDGLCV